MIFDMAAWGKTPRQVNLSEALSMHPMQVAGAQARSDLAEKYFSGSDFSSFTPGERGKIQALIDEEVAVVEAWAKSLNINVSNDIPKGQQVPWLFEQIRRRMYRIYRQPYTPRSFSGGGSADE